MTKFNKKNYKNTGDVLINNENGLYVQDNTQDYEAQKEKFLQKQQEQKEQKHIDKKVNEIFHNIIEELKRDNDQNDQAFDFSNIKETETDNIFKFEGSEQQQSTQKHNIEELKKFNFGENTPDTQANTPNDSEQGDNYENINTNTINKNLMEDFNMINKENNTAKELDEKNVNYTNKITKNAVNNALDNIEKEQNEEIVDNVIKVIKVITQEVLDDEIDDENGEGDGEIFHDCEDIDSIEKINESTGTTTEETFYDSINPWEAYINHNKENNKTFAKTIENLEKLSKDGSDYKMNVDGVKLNKDGKLEHDYTRGNKVDIYDEKLWAGGRFLLRFDTPDGADKFLASIDTSALYRREAATHGSEYDGKFLFEKKESGYSALFKGLFYGTHYGSDLQNPNGSIDGQSPGHLYINKENYTLTYYASKIPLIGSQFEKKSL